MSPSSGLEESISGSLQIKSDAFTGRTKMKAQQVMVKNIAEDIVPNLGVIS